MSNIHQKTHFKAAISISRGDACCVRVKKNEFGDQYAEIARNIDGMPTRNSAKDVSSYSTSKVSEWLHRNRNSVSQGQGRQRRIKEGQNQSMVNISGTFDGTAHLESSTPTHA